MIELGLLSKKTPEEQLVNELVGSGLFTSKNLRAVLNEPVAIGELQSVVQEAWKSGASAALIQSVYDENLARLQKAEKDGSLNPPPAAMGFADLPAETQDFLLRIKLKADKIFTLNERYNCVVEMQSDLAPSISGNIVVKNLAPSFSGHIFATQVDAVTKDDVKSFAAIASSHAYNEYIDEKSSREEGYYEDSGADSGPPTFVILITGAVIVGDLPKLVPGDWTGQTDKAMLYDSSKKILYGRNGVHMKFFKKVLEEWGHLEDLQSDKKYFSLRL